MVPLGLSRHPVHLVSVAFFIFTPVCYDSCHFLPVIKLHTGALKVIPSPCAVIFSYVFVLLIHREFHSASVTGRQFRQRESISLEIQQQVIINSPIPEDSRAVVQIQGVWEQDLCSPPCSPHAGGRSELNF